MRAAASSRGRFSRTHPSRSGWRKPARASGVSAGVSSRRWHTRRAASAPTWTLFPVAYQQAQSGTRTWRLWPSSRSFQDVAVRAASRAAFPNRPSRLSNRTSRSPSGASAVIRFRSSSASCESVATVNASPVTTRARAWSNSPSPTPRTFPSARNSGAGPGNANRASGVSRAATHAARCAEAANGKSALFPQLVVLAGKLL